MDKPQISRLPTPQPETVWIKCPQCSRENSKGTWDKFGKCPNCLDIFLKDDLAPPVAPSKDAKRIAELEALVERQANQSIADERAAEDQLTGLTRRAEKAEAELAALKSPSPLSPEKVDFLQAWLLRDEHYTAQAGEIEKLKAKVAALGGKR